MNKLIALSALLVACADATAVGTNDAGSDGPAFPDASFDDAHGGGLACWPTQAESYDGTTLVGIDTRVVDANGVTLSRTVAGGDHVVTEQWTCTYDAPTRVDTCDGTNTSGSIGSEKLQYANDGTIASLTFYDAKDVIVGYAKATSANGHWTEVVYSIAAGGDGVWGTSDDTWNEDDTYLYDGSGALHAIVFHHNGGVAYASEIFQCDATDVISVGASAPGPDGVWGTDDDVLGTGHTVYTGDGCGGSGAGCTPIVN